MRTSIGTLQLAVPSPISSIAGVKMSGYPGVARFYQRMLVSGVIVDSAAPQPPTPDQQKDSAWV